MKYVRLTNPARGAVLCERCAVAASLWTRLRGLLGRSSLPAGTGLLIVPCPSIHMFGMQFALDVVFLDRDNVVTDLVENILPGKMYVARPRHGKAQAALELPVGVIAGTGTQCGDHVVCEELPASV